MNPIGLQFLVQLADRHEFDFGGENGGVARFNAKGDAIAYAIELRRRSGRSARVLFTGNRKSPEVFIAHATAEVPAAVNAFLAE